MRAEATPVPAPDVQMEQLGGALADRLLDAMQKEPKDYSGHLRLLADLKLSMVLEAADAFYGEKYESWRPSSDFLWNLAEYLPDFNTGAWYRKRAALPSIAAAVVLGWLLGGFLSTFLGFLGLGGEILRPFTIFCLIWLGEYLSENPRARNILLTALGLGGLARFAASAAGGLIRFTTFGAWRTAIFGRAAMPNIFKSAWLFFGSFFVFIFLSKKITGMDFSAFKRGIGEQIQQRLKLAGFIFTEMDEREQALASCRREMENAPGGGLCPKRDCALATGVMSIMDSLDGPMRSYLEEKLAAAGYKVSEPENLIWQSAVHAPLYDTVGLINDGDHFKILRKAYQSGDKIVKGHAQRVATGG